MLVKYWMKTPAISINEHQSMQEAISRMKEFFAPMLTVLKKDKLVGVITDRDLKRASASDATTLDVHELAYLITKIKVSDIMTRNPVTVPPDYTLDETASILLHNKISGAPVVDAKGKALGVISQREIFRALISLTGSRKQGIQFAVQVEDRPGSIKEVTDIIRKHEGRLAGILTSYDRAPEGHRNVYLNTFDIPAMSVWTVERELGGVATLLYTVDRVQNRREEFKPNRRVA